MPWASVLITCAPLSFTFSSNRSAKKLRASHLNSIPTLPIQAVKGDARPKVKIKAMFFTRFA